MFVLSPHGSCNLGGQDLPGRALSCPRAVVPSTNLAKTQPQTFVSSHHSSHQEGQQRRTFTITVLWFPCRPRAQVRPRGCAGGRRGWGRAAPHGRGAQNSPGPRRAQPGSGHLQRGFLQCPGYPTGGDSPNSHCCVSSSCSACARSQRLGNNRAKNQLKNGETRNGSAQSAVAPRSKHQLLKPPGPEPAGCQAASPC